MGVYPTRADTPPFPREISPESHHNKPWSKSGMLQRLQHIFGRDDHVHRDDLVQSQSDQSSWPDMAASSAPRDSSARRVGIGLPRQATFRRQNSEKRERLCPVEPGPAERRAMSASRQGSISVARQRSLSSPPYHPERSSAPAVTFRLDLESEAAQAQELYLSEEPDSIEPPELSEYDRERPPRPPSITSSDTSHRDHDDSTFDKSRLNAELDSKWILNLSMHFRDKSDREKFFVTYAQYSNKWRRVTVSCDYRNAEPGSLEMELKELQFQRDKSLEIYNSIRDSLPDIQFYDTVTNLKLETTDGQLHVHVTEDVNEIIPYPHRSSVRHILEDKTFQPMELRESDIAFDAHLSGFVYKVKYQGKTLIKKEIPGPDTVDEFLYEVNALHALHGLEQVIQLEAIIVDDSRQYVKGLLIAYAERGAVVDLLYDHKGEIAWEDRSRWAQQAVQGLSEVHEEGYVQGDFTLSNIVVDGDNNAKIIDINRRGCPVGWEPPEIAVKIANNQRISMYIGEKTDLYQLGMTLWALAMDDDEPERHDPPLSVDEFPSEVPVWYQDIVRICLSQRPRNRLSAKDLLRLFPSTTNDSTASAEVRQPALTYRTEKEKHYINPEAAVERDDIERLAEHEELCDEPPYSPHSSRNDHTFTYPRSSNYDFESTSSAVDRPRGRQQYSDWEDVTPVRADTQSSTFSFLQHDSAADGPLSGLGLVQRPRLPSRVSITSASTPRNSHATLHTSSTFLPAASPIESPATEVAPTAVDPSIPVSIDRDSNHDEEGVVPGHSDTWWHPPSLLSADSGFDEPPHAGNLDETDTGSSLRKAYLQTTMPPDAIEETSNAEHDSSGS